MRVLLIATIAALPARAQQPARSRPGAQTWVTTWTASPQQWSDAAGRPGPDLDRQTVRQTVRVSVGGGALRLRLSNEMGRAPLSLAAVRVAPAVGPGGNDVDAASVIPVAFDGQASVMLPPGTAVVSDPVGQAVAPLGRLVVEIDVIAAPRPATAHLFANDSALLLPTVAASVSELAWVTAGRLNSRPILTGVLAAHPGGRVLVCLGDSLTDGVGSTYGADRRWPDLLAERLQREGFADVGVANAGIAGNMLLADGTGPTALRRFDHDVLGVPDARAVVLFEGINDIGERGRGQANAAAVAASIIAAERRLARRAHAAGLAFVVVTLPPFGGAATYSAEGESARQAVNAAMRASRDNDGLLDADMLLRDPAEPGRLHAAFDSGDHLHLNDAGYARINEAFPLDRIAAALR